MKGETLNNLVLLTLVLIISVLFLTMIHQFLMPMFMAGIFSAMLSPFHRWLTGKLRGHKHLASIITIIGIIFLILAPLSVLVGIVAAQAVTVGQSVTPFVQAFINEPSTLT
jgi:predicted PurR-regulated permease PerM